MQRFISYLRVSTTKQGQSGLGLEAQRAAIDNYLNGGQWVLLEEFIEIESGKNNDRSQLKAALEACRLKGATLIIAKLDRLSRSVSFISTLMDTDVEFICCDFPQANRLTIHLLAAVAEHEREMISKRTKEALQAAKARGVSLGSPQNLTTSHAAKGRQLGRESMKRKSESFAQSVCPMIHEYQQQGLTLRSIAKKLNDTGVLSARGKTGSWTPSAVKRIVDRHQQVINHTSQKRNDIK